MEKFTANSLPADAVGLPSFALNVFLGVANQLIEMGVVSKTEASAIGIRAAHAEMDLQAANALRRDRGYVGRVEREERWQIRLDEPGDTFGGSSVTTHDNGWVDLEGVASRVGVQEYEDPSAPGGIFREYRPPEEVLDPKSYGTFVGVPFTIGHPDIEVDSRSTRDLAHGVVLAAWADGELIRVKIRLWSEDVKAAIADGTIELSAGYSVVLDETPGTTPDGIPYDGVQRDITMDHLALVDLARAGHVARLRLDGYRYSHRLHRSTGDHAMKFKLRFDSREYTCPQAVADMLKLQHARTKKDRADRKAEKRADLDVGEVTLTPEAGGEPVTLVLPMQTVMQIVELLGAGEAPSAPAPGEAPADGEGEEMENEPAAAAPPAPAAPAAPGAPGVPTEEEDGGEPPAAAPPARSDGLSKAQLEAIDKRIDSRIEDERKRADALSKRRADTERRASRVLDSGFEWHKHDAQGIQVETIGKVFPDRHVEAQQLAGKARKGDAASVGALDMLFGFACDKAKADRQDEVDEASDAVDNFAENREDGADGDDGGLDHEDLDPAGAAKHRLDSSLRTGTIRSDDD